MENIIKKKTIEEYKEEQEDKNYNRYITKSISGIDDNIRKIVYFEIENMYIVYTNNTLTESIAKWVNQHKQ